MSSLPIVITQAARLDIYILTDSTLRVYASGQLEQCSDPDRYDYQEKLNSDPAPGSSITSHRRFDDAKSTSKSGSQLWYTYVCKMMD